jgi:two-component system CheB/CheR fusion protein
MDATDAIRHTTITALQIFATDIDDQLLASARQGRYPIGIINQVPAERLACYFTKDGDGYRISREIRDLCVFAKHEITVDMPYSRMDVIRCGSVVSRLEPAVQRAILSTFHYALRPGGYLLLKAPQGIALSASLFEAIIPECGLYRSRAITSGTPSPGVRPQIVSKPTIGRPSKRPAPTLQEAADQIVMGRITPSGVLVTDAWEIIQFNGNAERFFEPMLGSGHGNALLRMPFALRSVVEDAASEVQQRGISVRRKRLSMPLGRVDRINAVEVIPVMTPLGSAGYLILFEEQIRAENDPTRAGVHIDALGDDDGQKALLRGEVAELRRELAVAHVGMQYLEEQKVSLARQLQESLDETQSSSEEYHSTNEELQFSKRDVDTANRELIALNATLRSANADLIAASAEIRISGELTSIIVETMQTPLLVMSGIFIIERTNEAYLRAFGGNRQFTLGHSLFDIGDGIWEIPQVRRLLNEVRQAPAKLGDVEITHRFPAIGVRTIHISAYLISAGDEHRRLFVLTFSDISHQAHVMNELKSTAHELMRSNADLDHFAVIASHDLQEPLGVVSLYLEILKLQYGSHFDDRAREYMAHVTSGALRMTEMIRGILALSRPGNDGMDMTDVDCATIVQDARKNLDLSITQARAVITTDPLPIIRAHRGQITQVFQNILGNAVKYGKSKGHPIIHVTSSESEQAWTFSITDNGIGLREQDRDAIFQPFHRVHTDRIVKGFGIGLTTSRKIVERHKGRMWVDSKLGKGSTFFFSIAKPKAV